jgi:selenium metabolism protein YedF
MSNELKSSRVELNCQGLACPQPVIMTKKALERKPAEISVLVDNLAAKENVAKFAANSGYGVSIESTDGIYRLNLLAKQTAVNVATGKELAADAEAPAILLGRNTLGTGSEELGAILMKSFFVSLLELPQLPRAIMLINSGVYLAVADSPVLSSLQELSRRGVAVMVCGTCLDYFSLKEKLAVGEVTNMYSILSELTKAGNTITL